MIVSRGEDLVAGLQVEAVRDHRQTFLRAAREREILDLLAQGRSNAAIAEQLHLAMRSVEKHVTAIFTKLDLPQAKGDHRRVLAVLRYLNVHRD